MNLTINGEHAKTDMRTKDKLNSLFSNIVDNLNILQYASFDPIVPNMEDSTLKTIVKHKNYPSILTIQAKYKSKNKFYFTEVTTQVIQKEIFVL